MIRVGGRNIVTTYILRLFLKRLVKSNRKERVNGDKKILKNIFFPTVSVKYSMGLCAFVML